MAKRVRLKLGELRHLVEIQKAIDKKTGGSGQRLPTYEHFDTRWARVAPLTGRDLLEAKQINPTLSHEVEMHYADDIDETMRIVHNGRALNIEAVMNPEERNVKLLLLCSEAKGASAA